MARFQIRVRLLAGLLQLVLFILPSNRVDSSQGHAPRRLGQEYKPTLPNEILVKDSKRM